MEREQFTFYASFAKGARRIKSKAARCDYYDAIINYALSEVMPDLETIAEAAAMGFELIKPTLDSSRRKAENGKKGGSSEANDKQEQSASKPQANRKQTANKKENEKEGEKEKEIENECYTTTPTPPPLGEVMSFFLDNINATPSPDACEMLRQFTETLSADVVIHAMKIALDEKKTSWSYIRSILARYEREGLTTLDAVKAQEQQREQQKGGRQMMSAAAYAARDVQPIDMDKLRTVIDRI